MNPIDILTYGQSFMHEAFDGMPDDQWDTPNVCGAWSSKDVVNHLASFEVMLTELLGELLGRGGATPTLDALRYGDHEEFNRDQVGRRAGHSWQEARRAFEEAYGRAMALARDVPPDLWTRVGSLPWYGDQYALDDFIVYTFYGHKREHGAQINVFKDSL